MRWIGRALALALCCFGCELGTPDAAEVAEGTVALPDDAAELARLRDRGREGFAELLATFAAAGAPDTPSWNHALDTAAGQRDARFGRLYWETDRAIAMARAQERRVPILSLRLLGKLTEEHSCANSRFFRTILYSEPDLAAWLDRNFVLHWSTERPVPRVTVDFGDGRRIETTVTGNSAHLVLDAQGRPIDVVPGLYAPEAFRRALTQSLVLHRKLAELDDAGRTEAIAEHHREALLRSKNDLDDAQVAAFGFTASETARWLREPPRSPDALAREAGILSMAKSSGEFALSRRAFRGVIAMAVPYDVPRRDDVTPDREFLAALAAPVKLHPNARAIIARDRPPLPGETATRYEQRFERLVARFERDIGIDTLVNEYKLRPMIRRWLIENEATDDFDTLCERLYREAFLTPRSDPWLGLVDDAAYDGLIESGRITLPG